MGVMANLEARDKVTRLIVNPIRSRYTIPRGLDEVILIEDYRTDLKDFDEEVLTKAFLEVRRDWNKSSWPPAGFVRKACSRTQVSTGQKTVVTRFYDEADRMMLSERGQMAITEGWGYALYRHVHETGQDLPPDREEAERRAALSMPETLEKLRGDPGSEKGGWRGLGLVNRAWLQVGAAMVERDRTLLAKYQATG